MYGQDRLEEWCHDHLWLARFIVYSVLFCVLSGGMILALGVAGALTLLTTILEG
jgi:hypothetical protein